MKNLIYILIMSLLSTVSFAQNAYYEAKWLARIAKDKNKFETTFDNTFTDKTTPRVKGFETQKNTLMKFIDDPFTTQKPDFEELHLMANKMNFNASGENFGGAVSSTIPLILNGLNNFSGERETQFYDGLAKYITQEFKKSATQTYMQIFEEKLDKIGELQVLFPETYNNIRNRDPFTFPDFGKSEKELYFNDLRNLPVNLLNHIENEESESTKTYIVFDSKYNKSIKSKPQYPYFKVSIDIGDKLLHKYHLVDLANYLDEKYYDSAKNDTLGKLFHGLNILQNALRDTTKKVNGQFNNVWITFENLKKMTPEERKYFIALIYQEDKDFFKSFKPDTTKQKTDVIKEKILPFLEVLTKIKELQNTIQSEDKNYVWLMQNTFDIIRTIDKIIGENKLGKTFKIGGENISYYILIQTGLDVYKAIHNKDYVNLIPHLAQTIFWITEKNMSDENFMKFITAFNKYGNFMVEIVNAKDSDEMKDVISKNVLPANSYMKKRYSDFSLSISSHPNFYLGSETYKITTNGKDENETKFVIPRISAPVGLDFCFGLHKDKDKTDNRSSRFLSSSDYKKAFNGKSISALVTIIDLGSLVNFRLKNSDSTLNTNISFKQIFAPGISLNLGGVIFKNSPATIGLGWQSTPILNSIDNNGNIEFKKNGNRFFVRLSFDLPMLNLYNKFHTRVN